MIHPLLSLQSALHMHLSSNTDLLNILGADAIYDSVPRSANPPYISFGDAVCFDWSTSTEAGTEHSVSLNVWSDYKGRKEVFEIVHAIEQSILTLPTSLQDHALVNLTHESTELSKDIKAGLFLARVNLRAVTEPN